MEVDLPCCNPPQIRLGCPLLPKHGVQSYTRSVPKHKISEVFSRDFMEGLNEGVSKEMLDIMGWGLGTQSKPCFPAKIHMYIGLTS
jgi:hypothetical protein